MNTYDRLNNGDTVVWSELDEQGRYEAWSLYYRRNRAPFGYIPFCNYMDRRTSSEQALTGPL